MNLYSFPKLRILLKEIPVAVYQKELFTVRSFDLLITACKIIKDTFLSIRYILKNPIRMTRKGGAKELRYIDVAGGHGED